MNIVARPWEPQDLIDDLQMLIDEEPINYLNGRYATLCMARDYLKDHFRESTKKVGWISVEERLPVRFKRVLVFDKDEDSVGEAEYDGECFKWVEDENLAFVTHWMPLPEPPKEEV